MEKVAGGGLQQAQHNVQMYMQEDEKLTEVIDKMSHDAIKNW